MTDIEAGARGSRVWTNGVLPTLGVVITIAVWWLATEVFHIDPFYVMECAKAAEGRRLRFLANVDPIDASRALEGLDPETTLVVVISKTFTTAETMLNARTRRLRAICFLMASRMNSTQATPQEAGSSLKGQR